MERLVGRVKGNRRDREREETLSTAAAAAQEQEQEGGDENNKSVRKKTVLVVGANGKLGSCVVDSFLSSSSSTEWEVKALARASTERLEGYEGNKYKKVNKQVEVISGFDLADETTYSVAGGACGPRGLDCVVIVVGGSREDFQKEDYDPMNAQARGVKEFMEYLDASNALKKGIEGRREVKLVDFGASECSHNMASVCDWRPLNDTIMGGNSSSDAFYSRGRDMLNWAGDLVSQGGGFCGIRSSEVSELVGKVNAEEYDGIRLKVLGDGQRYKISVRTKEQLDLPEASFQASFDTKEDEWIDVNLRWEDFTAVRQTVVYDAQLKPESIVTLGLVKSLFSFNGFRNKVS